MTASSETILLPGCSSDELFHSFSSGCHPFRTGSNFSKLEDYPVLVKSEPISFSRTGGGKPRLRPPTQSHIAAFPNPVDRFYSTTKKKVKRHKGNNQSAAKSTISKSPNVKYDSGAAEPAYPPCASCAELIPQLTHMPLVEDEGFVESAVDLKLDPISSSLMTVKPFRQETTCAHSDQGYQPFPDGDVQTANIFGSPDLPRLWNCNTKPEESPLANRKQEHVSSSSLPDPSEELNEDDMEGTALLHLISNSLDRFNAIVHPGDLSTIPIEACADVYPGSTGTEEAKSATDFGSSGFGSLVEPASFDIHTFRQSPSNLLQNENSVPSLPTQYSTSCPSACETVSDGDTTLLNPPSSFTTDMKQIMKTDGENSRDHQVKARRFLNLSPPPCAVASSPLAGDHVNSQVKETFSARSCQSNMKAITPPPGFTASWTDLLFTQLSNDGDNNGSDRQRESVLVALQDPGMLRPGDGQSSNWLNNSPSNWTESDNAVDYSAPAFKSRKNEGAFPRGKSGAFVSGRNRLFSSCLPSELKNYDVHRPFLGLDASFGSPEAYMDPDGLKLSNLQKEFSQSLRFLTTAQSLPVTGCTQFSPSSMEISSTMLPNDSVHSNLSFSTASALLAPSSPIPSSGSFTPVAYARQLLPALSAAKIQDPSRSVRRNTGGHAVATRHSFGRTHPTRLHEASGATQSQATTHSTAARNGVGQSAPRKSVYISEPTEVVPNGKPVVAKWRRACSFYLRGHCKKEDCEFAHDLTKVTCKFWEMGECFKGATCPFLHGYPPEMADSD